MSKDQIVANETHEHNSLLEILFFTSPRCGPCHKLEKQLLETIKKRKLPIKITIIDVTKYPEKAEEYSVVACPTLIFRRYMKVCGTCERTELEELLTTYFSSVFEFQHNIISSSALGENNYA